LTSILFLARFFSIIFDRLSKNGKAYLEATTKHLNDYGETGLRTLALSYRRLEEKEYSDWNNEFQKAKAAVGADREAMLERVSDIMEKELILVGATAIEDKLQKGVGFVILSNQHTHAHIAVVVVFLHQIFNQIQCFILLRFPSALINLLKLVLRFWY
jgi:magnesium-transporting ATPase (P-type)